MVWAATAIGGASLLFGANESRNARNDAQAALAGGALQVPTTFLPGGAYGMYGYNFPGYPGATPSYPAATTNPLFGAQPSGGNPAMPSGNIFQQGGQWQQTQPQYGAGPTKYPGFDVSGATGGTSIKSAMWSGQPQNVSGGAGDPRLSLFGGGSSGSAGEANRAQILGAQTGAVANPYANDNSLLGRLMAQHWAAGQPTPAGTNAGTAAGGAQPYANGAAGGPGDVITYGAPVPGGAVRPYDLNSVVAGSIGDLDPTRSLLRDVSMTQQVDPQIAAAMRGAAVNNLGANTGDLSQQFLALMREQAAPYEQQQRNAMNQNLFSRGRLGGDDSVTGEAYRQFARGQSEADVTRQLGALQFGQGEAENMFQRGLSAAGGYDALQGNVLQRILGASGGAQDLTRLGTLPIELGLQLGVAKSNAALGVGTNLTNLSATAGQSGYEMANLFAGLAGSGAFSNIGKGGK